MASPNDVFSGHPLVYSGVNLTTKRSRTEHDPIVLSVVEMLGVLPSPRSG